MMTYDEVVSIARGERVVRHSEAVDMAFILLSLLEHKDERIVQAAEDALKYPLGVER